MTQENDVYILIIKVDTYNFKMLHFSQVTFYLILMVASPRQIDDVLIPDALILFCF